MSTVRLIYNTMLNGKWFSAGDPIEEEIVPANLRQYIAQPPTSQAESRGRHLNFELNRPYSVDAEGYLRGSPAQQAAQMEAEASEDEMIADQLAEAEVSETVAAAVEQSREDYRADVERQKLQASVKAKRQEAAEEFVREEQDAAVASGEYDQWDADARRDAPPRPPAVRTKPKAKGKRSFVRRNGGFVLASNAEVIEGEPLYRHRPKSFGFSEKYIVFAKVRKES
jgi:hypothetical protein